MSRIQNILNKAERDGTVRRVHTSGDAVGGAGLATMDGAATAPSPLSDHDIAMSGMPAGPAPMPSRLITTTPIDPRLVVALSAESADVATTSRGSIGVVVMRREGIVAGPAGMPLMAMS